MVLPKPIVLMVSVLCFGAFAAVAQHTTVESSPELTLPFLDIVPRSADETARVAHVLSPTTSFDQAEPFEAKPGGAASVRARTNADAFSQPSGNMPLERRLNFQVGNGLFKKLWVSSPSSTLASDGLGPLYNARSCQRCHLKDGRGHPPEGPQDDQTSMFLRLSVPTAPDTEISKIEAFLLSAGDNGPRTSPDPIYGGQLQDTAVAGHAAEGRMDITYEEIAVSLSGGEMAKLRSPSYAIADPAYGAPDPQVMLSPRVAPPMIGLGLLEAIPAADLLAAADPEDANGDGISGRAQVVWSFEHDRPMLGRFGWKAGAPTIREQSASAFAGDIGISSPLFDTPAGDCTDGQPACLAAPHGDGDARGQEVDAEGLDLVTFYSRNLALPERPDAGDADVLRGKEMFYTAGCTSCHTPKHVTHRLSDQPEQSFQLIWPYSDLLLHDMGDGLADDRPEGRASGREWRTPPLWGIGRTEQVNGHTYFLHDGRARSLLEAILWHGGEAEQSRDAVVDMPPEDRAALVRFLESL
ncbi:Cytochrome c [Rhodobacteraceae bacterium THAF1]|uniref:di-heme oxidoreductase family protein n=1 Tax=Palleronia sp. THAF1 TaxID=2587842 RepID=UPI000F41AA89|nr:di-heme oxidoredictase family protein [Palleronia sp. THAF1]QFU08795.1 Cytochrome c [Palleronia sp. THAF1]VDC23930.1 Cytochrome c [Rhodobacteraceae bacterium THAF1]